MVAPNLTKLSQIQASGTNFATGDFLVGIRGNTNDVRYSYNQLCSWQKVFTPQQFGSPGPGWATDNTPFIQAAINAASSANGGIVFLSQTTTEPWVHTGLIINHDFVYIAGAGNGGLTSSAPTTWLACSGSGIALDWNTLNVAVPLYGGGCKDIYVDGLIGASTIVRLRGVSHATFDDTLMIGAIANGYTLRLDDTSGVNVGNNRFNHCIIAAQEIGCSGISLNKDGVAGTSGGCSRNVFNGVEVLYDGSVAASHGLIMGFCDNNTFIELITLANSFVGGKAIEWVPQVLPGFPGENAFINCPIVGGQSGTPGTSGNWFIPYPTGDGEQIPLLTNTFGITYDGYVRGHGMAHTGVTFAQLTTFYAPPLTAVAGMTAYVTDSNTNVWGAIIGGLGANKVLAFYNGTNWTVAGI